MEERRRLTLLTFILGSVIIGLLLSPVFASDIWIIENRQLSSATGGNATGEANTASNLNPNFGLFAQKSGVDLQFKSIIRGQNIFMTSNGTNILVQSLDRERVVGNGNFTLLDTDDFVRASHSGTATYLTLPDVEAVSALDSTKNGNVIIIKNSSPTAQKLHILAQADDSIDGKSRIQLNSDNDAIILYSALADRWWIIGVHNGTNIVGESTTASNIGSFGSGIFSTLSGFDLQFKKLLGIGTGISVTNNSTNVIIENTAPDNTVCANVGTGSQVYKDGECSFRTLTAGTGISLTQNTNDVNIASTVVDTDKQIGQIAGRVNFSQTKTNIGNAYVDIYTTAFDEENLMIIDFRNATYFRIVWQWDYVGAGTQQVRWVDANNNTNVLLESATFTADTDALDNGWVAIPSAFVDQTKTIEWQGKSTTATDDPVAKGYVIYIK